MLSGFYGIYILSVRFRTDGLHTPNAAVTKIPTKETNAIILSLLVILFFWDFRCSFTFLLYALF